MTACHAENRTAGTWLYDCQQNTLKRFSDAPKTRQGTCGVIYDMKQDAFIAVEEGAYGVGPVSLHFLRYRKEQGNPRE